MLLGIYNSAALVSVSNNLRNSIQKHALESKLLGLMGQAEMEKEIQKTVTKIAQDNEVFGTNEKLEYELDENELKKYIDFVIREVKKENQSNTS
jgi:hypothetical protein